MQRFVLCTVVIVKCVLFSFEGSIYGLTAGYLKTFGIRSKVYVCAVNEATAVKIGHVERFGHSYGTNSLIFKLDEHIKADLYMVRLSDGTKCRIDLSRAEIALKIR